MAAVILFTVLMVKFATFHHFHCKLHRIVDVVLEVLTTSIVYA